MPELDLDRPRDLGPLISTAFTTWWHHLGVFVALAAIPVFPTIFLIDGLWGGALEDPDSMRTAAAIASTVVQTVVVAPLVVQEVLHSIRLLNKRGLTILLVEQNVAVSLKLSNRAYVLENGRIVMSGPGEALLHDDRVRQAYLGL